MHEEWELANTINMGNLFAFKIIHSINGVYGGIVMTHLFCSKCKKAPPEDILECLTILNEVSR